MANAGIIAELFEDSDSVFGFEVWSQVDTFLRRALDAGLESEDRGLWSAVCNYDARGLQALLDDGANPNSIVTLHCHGATKYFDDNKIDKLPNMQYIDYRTVTYDASMSILMYAVVRSTPEVVSILVSSGADVNYVGVGRQTPLLFMLDLSSALSDEGRERCARIARTLINAGANINRVDDHGDSALILASEHDLVDIVKLLVEKGIDINWRGRGNTTALMNAVTNQNSDLVRYLVDHGANPEIKRTSDGYTAFLIAAFYPSLSCINALIEKGANIFATDSQGWSALDILEYRDESIALNDSNNVTDWYFWNLNKEKAVDLLGNKGVRYKASQYLVRNSNFEEDRTSKVRIESYSSEVKAQKANGPVSSSVSNKKTEGCYIATAVYGSYDCPQVWTLRRFRDHQLSNTLYGRIFIRAYYAISPILVKRFGDMGWFRGFCRKKLDRMVAHLQAEGYESLPYRDRTW